MTSSERPWPWRYLLSWEPTIACMPRRAWSPESLQSSQPTSASRTCGVFAGSTHSTKRGCGGSLPAKGENGQLINENQEPLFWVQSSFLRLPIDQNPFDVISNRL